MEHTIKTDDLDDLGVPPILGNLHLTGIPQCSGPVWEKPWWGWPRVEQDGVHLRRSFFDESKMGLGFVVVQDEHYRNQDESVEIEFCLSFVKLFFFSRTELGSKQDIQD